MKAVRPCQKDGAKADYVLSSVFEVLKEQAPDLQGLGDNGAQQQDMGNVQIPKTVKWKVAMLSSEGEKKLWSEEVAILINPSGDASAW